MVAAAVTARAGDDDTFRPLPVCLGGRLADMHLPDPYRLIPRGQSDRGLARSKGQPAQPADPSMAHESCCSCSSSFMKACCVFACPSEKLSMQRSGLFREPLKRDQAFACVLKPQPPWRPARQLVRAGSCGRAIGWQLCPRPGLAGIGGGDESRFSAPIRRSRSRACPWPLV